MTFKTFVESLVGVIDSVVVPIIFAIAFLVFIWGTIKYYIIYGGDSSKRAEGREFVFWGLVGLVVAFSVWGILYIMLSTLGLAPA